VLAAVKLKETEDIIFFINPVLSGSPYFRLNRSLFIAKMHVAIAAVVDFKYRINSLNSHTESLLMQKPGNGKQLGRRPFDRRTHIVKPIAAAASGKKFLQRGYKGAETRASAVERNNGNVHECHRSTRIDP